MTLTLRHALFFPSERKIALKSKLYHTGQFAKRASVTVRTLRFYDRVGLLSPSQRAESGYRLYAEDDLLALQHILALKFLGFSLEEIKECLRRGPERLESVLARQRVMMREKRQQLDSIVKAIEETESLLESGSCDWESIARVIKVIQMEQKSDWVKKYFTDEQLERMQILGAASYSVEALQKLQQRMGEREWTEEDQQRADEQWRYVGTESRRLAEIGADPAGPEAQALAKFKADLLSSFTMGDPEVESGLSKFWENFKSLPESEKPFDSTPYGGGDAGDRLLTEAMEIYNRK